MTARRGANVKVGLNVSKGTETTRTTTTSTSSTSTKFSGPDIKQAALDTVANAVGEVWANKIGDLKADGLDTVTHKVLHAANGAVQGAIKSGGELDGAAAGAIGAAVGEIVAEVVDDGTATRTNEKGQQVTKVASIAAQIAAGLAGKDTDIAAGAATNAVENNRFLHTKELLALKELATDYAEKEGISKEEAYRRLLSQAMREVNQDYYDSHRQNDQSARNYLRANSNKTVRVGEKDVLFFTSGGDAIKRDNTIFANTLSQSPNAYSPSENTPVYTVGEKFETQNQVLEATRTGVSVLPFGGSVEFFSRYEEAIRNGDTETVKELERSFAQEMMLSAIPGGKALKEVVSGISAGGKKLFKKGEDIAGAPSRQKVVASKDQTSNFDDKTRNTIQKTPVEELDVGSYKDLKKREVVGDKLEHDHIPSAQSVIRAEEKRLGRKLNAQERKEVYNNATAVERTKESHKHSPTYGGKNTQKQIDNDSDDLANAACRDCDALRKTELESGKSPLDIDKAIEEVHDRNINELNIYTKEKLEKIKDKTQ
jgi:filamentous hemagglutinin